MHKDNLFPQYRKLSNGKAYYKIVNERNFEEIQLIGTIKMNYKIEAKQYPEILKIQDMLHNLDGLFFRFISR